MELGVGEKEDSSYGGPTFEDLEIDDTLDDLERITKYIYSNIALQRLVHVKIIAETAKVIGFEKTVLCFLPLLEPLVNDIEFVVRQHTAEQFPGIAKVLILNGESKGYQLVLDILLPLLAKLLADRRSEVRQAAGTSLAWIAELLQDEDQGQHILTIVLQLAHDDEEEDLRMTAVLLLNQLAVCLGKDLCHQFVTPEIISLSEDPVFRVRKATAMNIHNVCKISGLQDTMERLLPAYLRLANDDIWGVRKACAENMVALSNVIDRENRVEKLIPLFHALAVDTCKWVRAAAFQNLGAFLSTLASENITSSLISHFTWMATHTPLDFADHELRFHCAFSFPAVVVTLEKERWMEIAEIFNTLIQHNHHSVRRTLAYSLHEIAKVLGQEKTESDLKTAFDLFLQDQDTVREGVILHIAEFLAYLGPQTRETYLPVLSQIISKSKSTDWRCRKMLADQMSQILQLFSPSSTFAVVYPLIMQLVEDHVSLVRQAIYPVVPSLIVLLRNSDPLWGKDVVNKILEYGRADTFQQRQDVQLFCTHFCTPFFALAKDQVSNVRLLLIRTLLKAPENILTLQECKDVLLALQDDPDVDIKEYLLDKRLFSILNPPNTKSL